MPRLGHDPRPVRGRMMNRGRRNRMPRRQRGIAVIIVLWLTIMLTVIASGFAFSMRSEALSARNSLSLAQARSAADGAIDRMAFELSRPRMAASWVADGRLHAWSDGDITIQATAVDESTRIDLNSAPDALLKGLLEHVAGTDPETTAKIVDAIADWRDPDEAKRPNGAEEADYRQAGFKHKPANAPFETVSEVSRVMGVTPAIYARIADTLTVQSRQPGVNAQLAPRDVLLAMPTATPELVDAFIEQRTQAQAQNLPVQPFAPAANFVAGAVPVWRIRAMATVPDGVTFVREAVVRPSGDGRRPLLTLNWQEGSTVAAPTALASPATNPTQSIGKYGRP